MDKISNKDIAKLRKMLDRASNIVITSHISPDGDAVGASLGLYHALSEMGKCANIVLPDAPSEQLKCLRGSKDIITYAKYKEFAETLMAEADLIFCLDFNAPKRVGKLGDALMAATAPKVMIDHHLDPEDFCDVTISHPEASSASLVVYKTLCGLELLDAANRSCAECLVAGMLTDTGNLSYNANDPDVYYAIGELITRGADHNYLTKMLFDTFSEDCLRLNAYAVNEKMKVWADKGAALITLTRAELNSFHYKPGYTEGLVNKPLAIPEVRYSMFLREEDDYVKVSMRSKGDFPCDVICSEHFNGGGHRNASGGEFEGTMEQAVEVFESLLDENFEKYIM